jgi:hypothetical protein
MLAFVSGDIFCGLKPHRHDCVKYHDIPTLWSQDILYTLTRTLAPVKGLVPPAVHRGGPLVGEIEFPHQAPAVVHLDAMSDALQLHPFSR